MDVGAGFGGGNVANLWYLSLTMSSNNLSEKLLNVLKE